MLMHIQVIIFCPFTSTIPERNGHTIPFRYGITILINADFLLPSLIPLPLGGILHS